MRIFETLWRLVPWDGTKGQQKCLGSTIDSLVSCPCQCQLHMIKLSCIFQDQSGPPQPLIPTPFPTTTLRQESYELAFREPRIPARLWEWVGRPLLHSMALQVKCQRVRIWGNLHHLCRQGPSWHSFLEVGGAYRLLVDTIYIRWVSPPCFTWCR